MSARNFNTSSKQTYNKGNNFKNQNKRKDKNNVKTNKVNSSTKSKDNKKNLACQQVGSIQVYKDHITERNVEFENLCLKTQAQLLNILPKKLKEYGAVTQEPGFIYKEGTVPILLVAHMDTVHIKQIAEIVYANGTISSPQGIGGDDRCGVYMILKILEKHNCHVLFTEDEEIGCVGARLFAKSELVKELAGKFQYIIELDRKNAKDAVFYDCDNKEFTDFICKEYWKSDWGTYSDIVDIAPELKAAAVNLSCGYYKQHTNDEYVVLKEMEENIKQVCKLIERTTESDKFEYIEKSYSYKRGWEDDYYGYGYGYYNDYGYEDYYYIEYINSINIYGETYYRAHNKAEAVGKFLMAHPNLTYNNILSVCDEDEYYDQIYGAKQSTKKKDEKKDEVKFEDDDDIEQMIKEYLDDQKEEELMNSEYNDGVDDEECRQMNLNNYSQFQDNKE